MGGAPFSPVVLPSPLILIGAEPPETERPGGPSETIPVTLCSDLCFRLTESPPLDAARQAPGSSGLDGAVEGKRSKNGRKGAAHHGFAKSGRQEQLWKLAPRVCRGVVETVQKANRHKEAPHEGVRGLPPIGYVKLSVLLQHTECFRERRGLLIPRQMMKEETREHPIKCFIRIGKRGGKGPIKAYIDTGAERLAFRNSDDLRVAIHARDLRVGMRLLDPQRERSRPGTQIKNTVVAADVRLLYERTLEGPLARRQTDNGIIERSQKIVTKGGSVSILLRGQAITSGFGAQRVRGRPA